MFEQYKELLQQGARERPLLFADAETQSRADVRKVGSPRYATEVEHVMCWAYAFDDSPIELWTPTSNYDIADLFKEHRGGFVFHNAEFETWLLRCLYGIDISPERIIDSAAVARQVNLPGKLEDLGEFLGYPKDMDGNRTMLKLSRPRRGGGYWTPQDKPEDFERTYEYCRQDVRVSRHVISYCRAPSHFEKRVMDATARMNAVGFKVDLDNARRAVRVVEENKQQLNVRARALTGGISLTQVQKLQKVLGMTSLSKDRIRDELRRDDLTDTERELLELRREFAKSSTSKIDAMLAREVDGRIHDGLVYAGAERTCRWSGSGVQPQSMSRGAGMATFDLFDRLETGESLTIPEVASIVRGFINEPMYVGDYSQIECRLLGWLAGADTLLKLFRAGVDPYKALAARIYSVPVEEVTDQQRFLGKQGILANGYQLSGRGFKALLARDYDVHIEEAAANRVVGIYRKTHRAVPWFWHWINRMFQSAWRNPGHSYGKPHLACKALDKETVVIRLPSRRLLWYRNVHKDESGNVVAYGRNRVTGRMGDVKLYGGQFTAHIVQSTARDLMAHAVVALEDAGFTNLLTVHDEAVTRAAAPGFAAFQRTLTSRPDWLPEDFPLEVECFHTRRYRK